MHETKKDRKRVTGLVLTMLGIMVFMLSAWAGDKDSTIPETCETEMSASEENNPETNAMEDNASEANGSAYEIDYRILYGAVNYGEGPVYVVGHKNPDSDSVCSAIGYAEVLAQLGIDCEARIAGKLNPETQFALSYFGVETPEILENAAGLNIVLVDHNMYSQAVDGMKDANVVGILDHHNIGDIQTASPIMFRVLPLGSIATGVYLTALEAGVELSPDTEGLLATAILSDTNNLTAPTTTQLDSDILAILTEGAGIEDVKEYYLQMRQAKEAYTGMSDEEILLSDYKEYDMDGVPVAIASVDASGADHFAEMKERMLSAMKAYYEDSRLVHLYLMLNDYDNNLTELLYWGEGSEDVVREAFGTDSEGRVFINYVAIRKHDIVPPLTNAYKDQANAVAAVDEAA